MQPSVQQAMVDMNRMKLYKKVIKVGILNTIK